MSNEIDAFEYHYRRCSDKAKEYLNKVVLSSLINFKDKNALSILYAGCGVAPAISHLLDCLVSKGFVGLIKLTLVDADRKALDFALRKLQLFRSDQLMLNIECVCSEIKYYAHNSRDVFDVVLLEHPVIDLLSNNILSLLSKLFPNIMYRLAGEYSFNANYFRHAVALLSKKLKPEGIVMGACYTIIEHQQLKALLEIASEFKMLHSKVNIHSLFCLPIAEYSTCLLAKKTNTTTIGKMPHEQLLSHINYHDKLFLLNFLLCNALLFTVDKFTSLSETLKFAAVAMLGFYIQPILHNYSRGDVINKIIIPLLEIMICFLPKVLWPQEKDDSEIFEIATPFRLRQ